MKKLHSILLCSILLSFAFIFTNCDKKTVGEILNEIKPMLTTNDVTDKNPLGGTCGGTITNTYNTPVVARGIIWADATSADTLLLPTNISNFSGTALLEALKNQELLALADTVDGNTFNCTLRCLPNKQYKVRAFVISAGVSYGEVKTFSTEQLLEGHNKPVVTTLEPTEILKNTAVGHGTITSGEGIIIKGVCWGIDSELAELTIGDISLYNIAAKDAPNVNYAANIKGLLPSTTYKYRAFATNADGIGYGETKTFTTPAE